MGRQFCRDALSIFNEERKNLGGSAFVPFAPFVQRTQGCVDNMFMRNKLNMVNYNLFRKSSEIYLSRLQGVLIII